MGILTTHHSQLTTHHMIKRSGALLLTLLYTVTAMGFAFNLHYCCNQLTSLKINEQVKTSNMPAMGKMKCCQNKHFEVKVKDVHQGQSSSFLIKTFVFQLPELSYADFFFSPNQSLLEKDFDRGPPEPPFNANVAFLKNRIFRI